MANGTKPGEGAIVRADFGGGIDQSMDAWRVPPTQLSELVNGRLERVGSVRKRFGYVNVEAVPFGSPNTGNPIATIASPSQTIVVDRARQTGLDTDGSQIADECAYVARNYTPAALNDWTTRGAVSDIIGDVVTWDASAGEWDEAFDTAAGTGAFVGEEYVFILRITRARKIYGSLTGSTVRLVLTQYDAGTRAEISSVSLDLTGAVYPKLELVNVSGERTLIVAVATPNTRVGIDTNTVAATVLLWTCQYSNTGLGALISVPVAGCANDCDWSDLAAFQGTSAERYRPIVPFDIVCARDQLMLTVYSSRTGTVRFNRYAITAGAATFGAAGSVAKVGVLPVVALASAPSGTVSTWGVSVVCADLQMALAPPWQATDGTHQIWELDTATFAVVQTGSMALTRAGAPAVLPLLTPGTIALVRTAQIGGVNQWASFAELMQWEATQGLMFAHYIDQMTLRGGIIIDQQQLSSATHGARPFVLDYYGAQLTSGLYPVRLSLIVGSAQQVWTGRLAVTLQPTTDLAANYSGNIGTAIVTGPLDRRTTCANSPAATVAPRLLPTTPPRPFRVGTIVHVPHRPAVDAAGGFAFASVRLAPRVSGDALHGTFAGTAIAAGGLVQTLDSTAAAETAIVDRPRIGAVVRSGGGVAIDFTPGDYLLTAIFVYRDAFGNVHRSAPADPYRLTVVGAQDTWTIYYSAANYLTRDDATVEFYVTEPNGTVLRRWFDLPATAPVGTTAAGWRSVAVRDAVALGNRALGLPPLDAPTLYTTGGALPFVPVGSARFAFLFRNRLIVGGADDGRSVVYSNEPEAFEAPSFAVGNILRMEHEAGCTAAGSLGDKLVLFTPSGVYGVFGQFRDRFGAGNALSGPDAIHDYIGCEQPISVVGVPTGLLFLATDDRFYLLSDRLELVPIGLRVQDWTSTEQGGQGYRTCEAAVHILEEREVRFYLRNAAGARTVLVYNYQVDQWSRDEIGLFGGSAPWGGACYSEQLGCFVAAPGQWAREDRTTWKDGGAWVRLVARTAWIQPGGSQDYARVRNCQFLGRSASPHDLRIRVYTDFDASTVKAQGTWTAAQLAPIAATSWPAQVRLQVGSQKTQATQIRIDDIEPIGASTGQGPQLVGLALEVLPLGGLKRLPNTRKQ
jgi:hypothetical protein